jgi:hypothetical protein
MGMCGRLTSHLAPPLDVLYGCAREWLVIRAALEVVRDTCKVARAPCVERGKRPARAEHASGVRKYEPVPKKRYSASKSADMHEARESTHSVDELCERALKDSLKRA